MRLFLLTVLLVLCAGACHSAPKNEFLYVTLRDGTMQGYSVGADGHLTLLPFAPTRLVPASIFYNIDRGINVTADPVRPLLYASSYRIVPAARRQNCVSVVDPSAAPTYKSTLRAFRVGPDGHLSALAPAPVPPNEAIHSVVVDPKGHFLYALAEGGSVFIYSIANNGALTRRGKTQVTGTYSTNFAIDGDIMGSPVDDCIFAFDPNGKFVTLAFNTGMIIERWFYTSRYRVGANGTLHKVSTGSQEAGEMLAVCPTPDNQFVYLAGLRLAGINQEINVSGVRVFRVQKNGVLHILPYQVGLTYPFWAALTPSGKQLLVAYGNNFRQSDNTCRRVRRAKGRYANAQRDNAIP